MKTAISFLVLFFVLLLLSCGNYDMEKPIEIVEVDFSEMSIEDFQEGLKAKHFTIESVVKYYLNRIDSLDKNGPKLNSVICVNPDALDQARSLDQKMKNGREYGTLFGVPVLIKDNIDTHDKMACNAGSKALIENFPSKDSHIVDLLRHQGAIILGKTNLSEWANFRGMKSTSGWSAVGGQTHNPYEVDCNPCGSSAGSAVAVSADFCMFAVGTETDGSIVCPSSTNGIVGIKPTVGMWGRSGIIPISFTQDTPGPMTRTVRDAAIVLGALNYSDKDDPATMIRNATRIHEFEDHLKEDGLDGKRIGVYTMTDGIDSGVDSLMSLALEDLKKQGAVLVEVDSIFDPAIWELEFDLMLYEFKNGINKYLSETSKDVEVRNLSDVIAFNEQDSMELQYFGQEILDMADDMGSLKSKDYQDKLAQMLKGIRKDGIDRVMDSLNLDAIAAPTGSPAWKTDYENGDAYVLGTSSAAAMAGYPNISVPMGRVGNLPVGISFFGKAWSEATLIEVAYSYEQATQHCKTPEFIQQ